MVKFRDNVKMNIVMILIAAAICVLVVGGVGNKNYDSEVKGDVTVENVAGMINDNLAKQGKHLTMGSISYREYLMNVLMHDSDKELKKSPYYDDIKAYASCYVGFNDLYGVEIFSLNYFLAPFREIPADMKGKTIKELSVQG